MAEITDTNLLTRIRNYLGLRGRTMNSSRNSVYPALIVNADAQYVPVLVRTKETAVRSYAEWTEDGTWYDVYTVPAGKRAFIFAVSVTQSTAAKNAYFSIRDSGSNQLFRLATMIGAGSVHQAYTPPIPMNAGEKVSYNADVGAGAGGSFAYWEEEI